MSSEDFLTWLSVALATLTVIGTILSQTKILTVDEPYGKQR